MPTLLFWNTNRRDLSDLVAVLAREIRADIIILAECTAEIAILLRALNSEGGPFYEPDPGISTRLKILSLYPEGHVVAVRDTVGVSIRHYMPPVGASFLLAAVHLSSKLHQADQDQNFLSTRVVQVVQEAERQVNHSRTIVLGDFNMNPFEHGMVAARGFHAIMDRRIALQKARVIQAEEHSFFYNPMWSHLGDCRRVPGTYFYNTGSYVNFFWNIFDQILIRPSVLPAFSDESIEVVTSIEGISLLSAAGRPDAKNFSDHLPIVARLKDLKEEGLNVD